MTAEEIRDLGYLKWRDPWAWMETMKGKQWENLIKKEKENFNQLANQPNVVKEALQMETEIRAAQQYMSLPPFKIGCGTIDIFFVPGSRFIWRWTWNKMGKPSYDIDVQGNIVWYITSDEDKHFKNLLICEDSTGKIIWSKESVSTQIAVIGEFCYYIKVVEYFRTIELCGCNAKTGNNEKVLYRESDKSRDLILIKAANKTLYLKSEDPINSKLFRVDGLHLKQLAKTSLLQIPLGKSIYGDDCLLIRDSRFKKWIPNGQPIDKWIFPDEEIEWINLATGNLLTMNEGSQTIWYCAPNKKPQQLFKVKIGTIEPNTWTAWENSLIQSFIIKSPFEIPYMINIVNQDVTRDTRKIQIKKPIDFNLLEVHRFHAKSRDGTNVPFIIIHEKCIKPKAQLIYVYGAYGSSTPIGWPNNQWWPLLKRKWSLVFALVRGGGDMDLAWAEQARRNNRHVVVEDFEAVIRAAQHKNSLLPEQTVIYGRSAGGVPVGAIISRFPDGQLVGAAFTEVPYVDLLRTSTNPTLPLTIGEYNEFGNPLERILNFRELLSVSPINTLPPDGAPGVFVICRVGLLDNQVYAYESFKWIQKLRGNSSLNEAVSKRPKGKFITFERKEAHQYRPNRFPRFRAIDLAILDAWVDNKLRF